MAKRNKNKYLEKALETLNLQGYVDDEYYSVEDLINLKNKLESLIKQTEINVEIIKDGLEEGKKNIEIIQTILNQVEIEEWKELNPKALVFKI